MKNKVMAAAALALIFALNVQPSHAAPIEAFGTCALDPGAPGADGTCTKEATFDDTSNLLTIILTNTSSSGYITGDAFTLPVGVATAASGSSDDPNFGFFALANTQDDQPSGGDVTFASPRNWAFLIDVDNTSWEAGGQPSAGIGPNEKVTFTIQLDTALNGSQFDTFFASQAIRFRGFANGGSDKDLVIRGTSGGEDPVTPVPEPTSLVLLGTGLLYGVNRMRKRG